MRKNTDQLIAAAEELRAKHTAELDELLKNINESGDADKQLARDLHGLQDEVDEFYADAMDMCSAVEAAINNLKTNLKENKLAIFHRLDRAALRLGGDLINDDEMPDLGNIEKFPEATGKAPELPPADENKAAAE